MFDHCIIHTFQDQYVFIHDVLLEYIHSGETEVKDFAIVQYVKDLIKRDSKDGSLLEKQYQVCSVLANYSYRAMSIPKIYV